MKMEQTVHFSPGDTHGPEPLWRYILIGLFFWAVSVFFARFSLQVPFFEDDLHLVRVYSPAELRQVWQGPWDPDGLETPGFRPLTTLFNHARASVLGESVVVHRLFLLGLFAAYLTLAVALARRRFGASYRTGLLGGLLALLHLSSTYHYVWISDGIHLLSGILILSAILLIGLVGMLLDQILARLARAVTYPE